MQIMRRRDHLDQDEIRQSNAGGRGTGDVLGKAAGSGQGNNAERRDSKLRI